ncbi:hypothetical protein NFI96_009081, partial [Prochilodus magdalenae]
QHNFPKSKPNYFLKILFALLILALIFIIYYFVYRKTPVKIPIVYPVTTRPRKESIPHGCGVPVKRGPMIKVGDRKSYVIGSYVEHRLERKTIRTVAIVLRSEQVEYYCVLCCDGREFSVAASNVLGLVQAMEMFKILGVQKVAIYKTSCDPAIQKILDYYVGQGFVDIIPWNVTSYIKVSRSWQKSLSPGELHYFGQIAALNDCVYRYMYESQYVALQDLDEFILPLKEDKWTTLIPQLKVKYPQHMGFEFESSLIPIYISNDQKPEYTPELWKNVKGVNILSHVYRVPVDTNVFNDFKVIVNPRLVFRTTVHGLLDPRDGTVRVDSKIARIYHIRHITSEESSVIRDTRLWDYAKKLIPAVSEEERERKMLKETDKVEGGDLMEVTPALICEKHKAPVADLPILVFCGKCKSSSTVLASEHRAHYRMLGPQATLMRKGKGTASTPEEPTTKQTYSSPTPTTPSAKPQQRACGVPVRSDPMVKVGDRNSYVIGSYVEHRLGRKMIRTVAIVLRSEQVEYYCVLCCDGREFSVAASCDIHSDHFGFEYGTADITCPVTENCTTPAYVAITYQTHKGDGSLWNIQSFQPVGNQQPRTENFPYTFTVCISVMYDYSNVLGLVQAMEMFKILGVQKVAIYKTSCDPAIQKILDYYVGQGFVDIIPWTVTSYIKVSRGWQKSRSSGELHYHGQIPALTDCVYRYMYESQYVALQDLDEFILPLKEDNWTTLIPQLEMKYAHRAGFEFENNVFPFSLSSHQKPEYEPELWKHVTGENILPHVYRIPVNPKAFNNIKVIVNP